MPKMKIRPSSLGKIMTNAKSKKPEDLSVGAITHCYEQAKQFVYGYYPQIKSKAITKGINCEQDSIDLYNLVHFTQHAKNDLRVENDWLSGECDIDTGDRIIDIKTSWSIATFPALSSQIDSKLYEWQGRGYMLLLDRDEFELAYCFISTPESLCEYEQPEIHNVDHIDPTLRVTSKLFKRDEAKEDLIKIKCEAAQKQIDIFIEQITNEHSGV